MLEKSSVLVLKNYPVNAQILSFSFNELSMDVQCLL
jgi:hypothetical protein